MTMSRVETIVDRSNEHYILDVEGSIQLVFYTGGKRVYEKIKNCPFCTEGELRFGERVQVSNNSTVKCIHFRCWSCGYYLFL